MKRLLIIAMLVAGCSSVGVAPTSQSTPQGGGTQTTPEPVEEAPADVTPVPVDTTVFKPGDPIVVMAGDEDLAEITVTKVKQRTKYTSEFYDDVPVKGNVYIEMFVTYEALAQNADYSPFDWQVYVDDVAVDTYAIVLNGPKPELSSGSLPTGRKAQGWLVFEIPKTGRAVLSYASNMFSEDPPVFEVVLRNK